jgi:hypothetical protein
MFRLGVALAGVVALVGVMAVLVVHARGKGKLSYCRNNLRMLGLMGQRDLDAVGNPEQSGRAFWQWVRERKYYSRPLKTWSRNGTLNPFGCPVRGVAPLDLSTLDDAAYAQLMSDASTIDYRGPKSLPDPVKGVIVLGSDREGNHPSGGHVLLADMSVVENQDKALKVATELWSRAGETGD